MSKPQINLTTFVFVMLTFAAENVNGRSILQDTCIDKLKPLTYTTIDSQTALLKRRADPNFIQTIKECNTEFKGGIPYSEKSFEMRVPKYFIWSQFAIVRVTYGFGENYFYFHLYDGIDSLQRAIIITYDFGGDLRKSIANGSEITGKRYTIKNVQGHTIYSFNNWQDHHCGQVLYDNGIVVQYCAIREEDIPELEKSILTFKIKNDK